VKIKLNEHLPVRLARALEKLGHDTDTIPEEGMTGRSDLHIESLQKTPTLATQHNLGRRKEWAINRQIKGPEKSLIIPWQCVEKSFRE
jgi:uncharacterized protein DUF5615